SDAALRSRSRCPPWWGAKPCGGSAAAGEEALEGRRLTERVRLLTGLAGRDERGELACGTVDTDRDGRRAVVGAGGRPGTEVLGRAEHARRDDGGAQVREQRPHGVVDRERVAR